MSNKIKMTNKFNWQGIINLLHVLAVKVDVGEEKIANENIFKYCFGYTISDFSGLCHTLLD